MKNIYTYIPTYLIRLIKILEYKQLKTFFLTKKKVLGLLIFGYFFQIEKNKNIILMSYISISFIFKLLGLMGVNVDFLFISLLFSIFSMEHTFDFFSNESLFNEDSSTLNIGESSSQGSSGQNINSGESSSQGPSGENPNKGGNPSPHNGAPDPYDSDTETLAVRDTDRLAVHLVFHENKTFNQAGIRFTRGGTTIGTYDEDMSRIARYVRQHHDPNHTYFYRNGPHTAQIDSRIISFVVNLRKDVPNSFR
jgi:hypothetical protein